MLLLYTEVGVHRLEAVTCGLYLLLLLGTTRGQDDHHILRLHNDIIKNNNPKVRPVKNSSDTITVFLQLHLLSMSDFDEVTQTVTANGFFFLTWKDEFLTWNASEYGGVGEISPDYGMVWRPYITIRNVVESVEPLGLDFGIIKVTADGIVTSLPGDTFKTFCLMDVTNFPLDEQECTYSTLDWGNTIKEVDLQPINNSIGLDLFNANSQWDIIHTSAHRVVLQTSDMPHPFINFKMTLKRKSSLVILTTLLPVLMLALVNVMVFLIPVESGEKLSFAITVLLSFMVSLTFITGLLPQNGDTLPVFTIFIVGQFVMSSIYVFLTIWITQVFYRDAAIRPVPSWMGRITRAWERCIFGTSAVGNQETLTQERMSKDSWNPPSVTWKRVSRMMNKLFFCLFFMLFIITTLIGFLKIAYF
ncbi:neuronal acetylcholine receptor subunit alpha-7-like [Haliotis rufescens]|uniref:neuronal acetylcholine receptor subunit alpha-7-like n=1 Tax=Haliotis rufescens TaxID=6454 RepID=UPI00201FB147|nr:neuronal acetylcholine receptor subunit alpha-7-like [Haliotis rufescens]